MDGCRLTMFAATTHDSREIVRSTSLLHLVVRFILRFIKQSTVTTEDPHDSVLWIESGAGFTHDLFGTNLM